MLSAWTSACQNAFSWTFHKQPRSLPRAFSLQGCCCRKSLSFAALIDMSLWLAVTPGPWLLLLSVVKTGQDRAVGWSLCVDGLALLIFDGPPTRATRLSSNHYALHRALFPPFSTLIRISPTHLLRHRQSKRAVHGACYQRPAP